MNCSTASCAQPATLAWERYATDAETTAELTRLRRAFAAAAGDEAGQARVAQIDLSDQLPMRVIVGGCDLHQLPPDVAAVTQGAPAAGPQPITAPTQE